MRLKKSLPTLVLLLIVVAVGLLLLYRAQIKGAFSFNSQRASISFNNLIYPATPVMERRPPLSMLTKETELALYIGPPFKDFTRAEWKEFWHLVYGAFPKDEPPQPGLPQKVRQLTNGEIREELANKYPQPFANFPEEYWKAFFDILFKK